MQLMMVMLDFRYWFNQSNLTSQIYIYIKDSTLWLFSSLHFLDEMLLFILVHIRDLEEMQHFYFMELKKVMRERMHTTKEGHRISQSFHGYLNVGIFQWFFSWGIAVIFCLFSEEFVIITYAYVHYSCHF